MKASTRDAPGLGFAPKYNLTVNYGVKTKVTWAPALSSGRRIRTFMP